MPKFRLTLLAETNIRALLAYSYQVFGEYQSEAYAAGLTRTFGLLSDFPGIGTRADEFLPGLRRFRFQSHYVYYTQEHGEVLIRAVFHVRQLPRKDLFE